MTSRLRALSAGLAIAIAGCGGGTSKPAPAGPGQVLAKSGSATLVRVQSGELIDLPLHGEARSRLNRLFEFNGSAPEAHRTVASDASGLHVGVTRHKPGVFEGFFAVTHAKYPAASVFHTRMTRPAGAVANPKESGETVFAVQTGNTKQTGLINYVLVATFTSSGLFHELVGYAHGKIAGATTKVLWESPYAKTRPESLDIDLRTDGSHSLEVWLNQRRVYSATNLNMNIEPPFQPYLEVQALGIPYVATFQDFHVLGSDTITISGLKPGATVVLTPKSGQPVRATAGSDGKAVLTLGVPGSRGLGTLEISGTGLKTGEFVYAGGDVLALR